MKYAPIFTLSLLLLFSCAQKANKQNQGNDPDLGEEAINLDDETENEAIDEDDSAIRAKFIEFSLGDAEHYTFEKENGERIVFDGSEANNYNFGIELPEAEANSENQGWGSNKELQGKWFKLTFFTRQQPQYIDGPMGTARIINKAVLEDDKNNKTATIKAPKSFKVLGEVDGDLDKDGISEKVIVYDTGKETDMGTERQIYIYKKNNATWELWKKVAGGVLGSDQGGVMGDPFEGVAIERNCIVINHFGGSRQKWNYTHRFRYQNENFELIGVKVSSGAPCDYFETFDYNVTTGKINYEMEIDDCENDTSKIEKKELVKKLKPLPILDGFSPGTNKIAFPNSEITMYY